MLLYCEIWIENQTFSLKKLHLKTLSAKCLVAACWHSYCVIGTYQHWFSSWLVVRSSPRPYLYHPWVIVILRNKLCALNFESKYHFLLKKNASEKLMCKNSAILFTLQCVPITLNFHCYQLSNVTLLSLSDTEILLYVSSRWAEDNQDLLQLGASIALDTTYSVTATGGPIFWPCIQRGRNWAWRR